jgi:hypothetical protein
MIIFDEIQVDDVVKIKTIYDEIEEELYAKVVERLDTTLIVKYYIPTSKVYKGATLYALDSDEDGVLQESLTEHYIKDTTPFEDKGDMVYIPEEIMSDCSDSEVEDMSESEEEEDDFVVPDGTEPWVPPPDSAQVDASWNSWEPPTPGARNFKAVVDRIEQLARIQEDELQF